MAPSLPSETMRRQTVVGEGVHALVCAALGLALAACGSTVQVAGSQPTAGVTVPVAVGDAGGVRRWAERARSVTGRWRRAHRDRRDPRCRPAGTASCGRAARRGWARWRLRRDAHVRLGDVHDWLVLGTEVSFGDGPRQVQAVVDDLNRRGGIGGRPVERTSPD